MPLPPPKTVTPTTRSWDGIDRAALLRLSGRRETGTEFGYLLRHYALPAMVLRYADTVRQRFPGGETVGFRHVFEQELRRCSADRCLWREKTLESVGDDGLVRFVRFRPEERLCEYDRARQTWQTFSPLSVDHVSENVDKLADTAILCQNLMPPLLPIRPGFRWHVESKNGHMEFCFESVETVGDMTVLLIRRSGELILNEFYRFGVLHPQRYRIRREGLSAYSLEQSAVLEDCTRDIVEPAGRTTALENLETVTVRKLVQSRPVENRVAPLFLKHAVKRHRYVYDCGTGRILEVDSVIDTILDDFDILTEEEIQNKYDKMGREKVRTAIGELRILQHRGYMLGHPPTEPSRIDRVYDGELERELGEFWQNTSQLLILGLTERCNLNCEYCCYSGKFPGQRSHGPKTMTPKIARKAITDYMASDLIDGHAPISFYGGEPLLEFHLLKECVRYAVSLGESRGKKPKFAITTNGTLLDDETVDFLVAHNFLVMISLDGPKEAHDRYRVFPDGKGSFDLVAENLRRFIRRYPGYTNRGLSITLAPPLALEETARFVESFYRDYPFSRASLVNVGPIDPDQKDSVRYGCFSKDACQKNTGLESFQHFREEDRKQLKMLWDACVASLKKHGAQNSWKTMPLAMLLFETQLEFFHRRSVTNFTPDRFYFIPCIPGFTRRFCDASGNYRVCERVDDSEAYRLGNVWNGLDAARMKRTMELRRHHGDCGNCETLKFCDVCYARISRSDDTEAGYDPGFDSLCRKTRQSTTKMLQTYIEIMEANPQAFDKPDTGKMSRSDRLRFGSDETDRETETTERIKRETFDTQH